MPDIDAMEPEVVVLVRRVLNAINDRTLRERAEELLDPSIVRHDLVHLFPDSHGRNSGADLVGTLVAAMPDFHLDIEDIFGYGDRVAVRLQITGTHTGEPLLGRRATAQRLSTNAVFVYRVHSGRVIEAWQMLDGLGFYRFAGLLRG